MPLQANREAMSLFSTETFLGNVFRVASTRRKELVLEVNFDPDKVELFKEVRSRSSILSKRAVPVFRSTRLR
jgi:hypothetical protein